MDKKYIDLWDIAKPVYQTSRPFDLEHIQWLLSVAEGIAVTENIDKDVFIPLVILHDIGYSDTESSKFWQHDIRKAHMLAGAKMAQQILRKQKYTKNQIEKITYYISVHDEWALGNNEGYKHDKLLSIFTDLDFIWMASEVGFPYFLKSLNKTPTQMIDWLVTNEKLTNRPFASKSTKQLFDKLIKERRDSC